MHTNVGEGLITIFEGRYPYQDEGHVDEDVPQQTEKRVSAITYHR